MNKKNKTGFSLIELMVTIVTIGILAAIAVPAYKKYAESAKIAEAYQTLGLMVKTHKSYYASESDSPTRRFFTTEPLPDADTHIVTQSAWDNWNSLGITPPYSVDQQTLFHYSVSAGQNSQTFGEGADQSGTPPNAGGLDTPLPGLGNNRYASCLYDRYTSQGGSGPANDINISANTFGITDPGTGTFDWAVLSASGGLSSSSGTCTYVFQAITTNNGEISSGGMTVVQHDFE
jgi:prepilin-type N-terminal cleavage/methylation domain-containing protein